jgi:hypothetical protein
VTGTGIQDLYLLLEQTKDSGIDVYTHGELLGAHAYPELKKYAHFAGQYGGSWQTQKEDFEQFHGPVLATSEGVFLPKPSYKGRLYTTGSAGISGCMHIEEAQDGGKDFSALIDQAKTCDPPAARETGIRTAGFSYGQLFGMADRIAAGLKDGTFSKIAVMIGDDGRAKMRSYYTDMERAMPEDALLLTISERAIRLFCFAYVFRWFVVTTQSFLSAIEKPVLATMMSLGMALVFPVLMLGALWTLELDGIWLNFVGVNILGASLGGILLLGVLREIRKRERAKQQPQES